MHRKIIVSKKDFSDKRLHPLFKKKTVLKMVKFYSEYEKYCSSLDKLKKNKNFLECIKIGWVNKIICSLKNRIKKRKRDLNKIKRKGKCLCCGKRRESRNISHIIERAAYKHYRIKPRKYFDWYINSVPNLLPLCDNCHCSLDREEFPLSKIKHIISKKRNINNKILTGIKKDMKFMKKVNVDIKKLKKNLNKLDRQKKKFLRSYIIFLERKADISKKDIRKSIR